MLKKNFIFILVMSFTLLPAVSFAKLSDLRDPQVIKVSIHQGYLDNRSKNTYVGGKLMQEWVAYLLSLECQNNPLKHLCDYQLDHATHNEIQLSKVIETADGPVKVVIYDVAPEKTGNDQENRTTYKEEQIQLSAMAKQAFHQAISESDIVFYMGHSRYGGGPDFSLPVLTRTKAHNEYYYKNEFTGFKELISTFKKAARLPTYFALLSCSSGPHFGDQLKAKFPKVNYVFTKDVETQNAEQASRKAMIILNGLIDKMIQP